jgi:hypothetical protein
MNTPDGSLPSPFNTEYLQFTAEKVGIYIRERLPDFPGVSESAKVEYYKSAFDGMIAQIQGWLVGGKIPTEPLKKEVRWPDGAWQMFKELHLPEWFKKKFPVRYHTEEFTVQTNHYFVCPHIVTDPREKHIQFMATGTRIASMMHPEDRRW